jgi:hypothetical protein
LTADQVVAKLIHKRPCRDSTNNPRHALLLELGANTNASSKTDEILLHKVCRLYPQANHYGADFTDQLLAAQALIKRGANINATCTS